MKNGVIGVFAYKNEPSVPQIEVGATCESGRATSIIPVQQTTFFDYRLR